VSELSETERIMKRWMRNPTGMKEELLGLAPGAQERAEDEADPYVRKPWYKAQRTQQIRDQKFEEFQEAMKKAIQEGTARAPTPPPPSEPDKATIESPQPTERKFSLWHWMLGDQ
jgi:hypothetical protein